MTREIASLLMRCHGQLNWTLGVLEALDAKRDLAGLAELEDEIADAILAEFGTKAGGKTP
jgi:hypothetical protein